MAVIIFKPTEKCNSNCIYCDVVARKDQHVVMSFDLLELVFKNIDEFLKSKPDINIQISGHTDNVGPDDYNLKLSQQRAQAVVDYMIAKEISSSRLSANGFGKTQPVESNESEMGRQKNRRVEFTIM